MTRFPSFFAELTAPIPPEYVKTRSQGGRQFSYITARTVLNRLDEVCGPEGWEAEYFPGENSVICKLTITLPDGSKMSRVGVGGYAGMADQGDDDKSGWSDALKKAAVEYGVARELYLVGTVDYAGQILDKNVHTADTLGAYLKAQFEEMTAKFAAYCKEQKKKAGDLPTFGDFLAKLTDEVRNFHIVPQSVSAEDCVAKLVSAFNTKARYSATAVERTLAAIKKELAGKLS